MVCRCGACKRCRNREAHARYEQTAKGKAVHKRYRQSAKGRAVGVRTNAHRIYVGRAYHGRAQTIARATVIQNHIKERVSAFKRQQTGAEAEGGSARAVSAQAKP